MPRAKSKMTTKLATSKSAANEESKSALSTDKESLKINQPKRNTRKQIEASKHTAQTEVAVSEPSSANVAIKQEPIDEEENTVKKPKRKPIQIKSEDASDSKVSIKKEDCVSDDEVKKKYFKFEPLNWKEVLQNLREMRKNFDAPVDSMGCDKCYDELCEPEVMRFQVLVSLMLSSQTKDKVTFAAMQRLKEAGCTIPNIISMTPEKLGELIFPVGFWKRKVKYIKQTAEILRDKYNSDIPKTVPELCSLSGVGPKMAHLAMKSAWGEITGIGVDTHVHRISNRLGWVNTKTPEGTRKALEDWLLEDLWGEVNHLLVGFGQQICKPIKPQCATCLNYEICPFGRKQLGSANVQKLNAKIKKSESP